MPIKDLAGKSFGKLIVIEQAGKTNIIIFCGDANAIAGML